jgi:hypothetical protein
VPLAASAPSSSTALLLIRVAENHTGQAWPAMRRELQRIAIGTFTVERAILPRTRVSAARKFSYRSRLRN